MAMSLPGNKKTNSLQTVQTAVDELYEFRDHYFENHGIEQAHQKLSDVQKELEKTMAILDAVQDPLCTKAEYLMLRGRALNVLPQYSKEAEDCLSKAVKLDPKLAEAWSYLGECYWKNNQVELARNCFVGSLNHIWLINTKYNVLYVHGPATPGPPHCFVRIYDTVFKYRMEKLESPPPMPTFYADDAKEPLPEEFFDKDLFQFTEPSIVYSIEDADKKKKIQSKK